MDSEEVSLDRLPLSLCLGWFWELSSTETALRETLRQSPMQSCPVCTCSHLPTSPMWLRLWSVWEKRDDCPAESWPKVNVGVKPAVALLSVVCPQHRGTARVESQFHFSCQFQGFGKERSGVSDGYGRIRQTQGAECLHFTFTLHQKCSLAKPNVSISRKSSLRKAKRMSHLPVATYSPQRSF